MNTQDLIQSIREKVRPGTVIPKPAAREASLVKGWGKRAGEEALIYCIPNHNNPSKPYQKGITVSEWKSAYSRLVQERELTRDWFWHNLKRCADEGGCNFTTLGGVFSLLGLAVYDRRGVYRAV